MYTRIRGPRRLLLFIPAINKDRAASRVLSSLHIAPTVADHKTFRQIHVVFPRAAQNHPRLRLPALAMILVLVKTNKNIIQRQLRCQFLVNLIYRASRSNPLRYTRR